MVKNLLKRIRDIRPIPAGKIPWRQMATHDSILAWEMLWIEELGWLAAHGVAKERHNFADQTTADKRKDSTIC